MGVCLCVQMPMETRKRYQIPQSWSYRLLETLAWLLGSGPLDEAASTQWLRICIYKRISID